MLVDGVHILAVAGDATGGLAVVAVLAMDTRVVSAYSIYKAVKQY